MRLPLLCLLPVVAGLSACSTAPESSTPAAKIYVDAVIPREVTKVPVVPGESPTLGGVIDAVGGLVPAEKDGYIQILREGARPIVIPVRDFDAHRRDPLQPGDSVYIGLKRN